MGRSGTEEERVKKDGSEEQDEDDPNTPPKERVACEVPATVLFNSGIIDTDSSVEDDVAPR